MTRGPDFLRPVARPGALAWAWCATGLLVLAVATADAAAAWAGRQQAVLAVQALNRPAPAVVPAPRRDGRTPAALPDAAAAQHAAAQRWLQQLAHPWPQVWAASEAASAPGIAWLVLEHSVQGVLRLEGLAPDEGLAQRAAQVLRDSAGAGAADAAGLRWQDVALVRVERVVGGQRFELSARLGPGLSPAPTRMPAAAPAVAAAAAATAATLAATHAAATPAATATAAATSTPAATPTSIPAATPTYTPATTATPTASAATTSDATSDTTSDTRTDLTADPTAFAAAGPVRQAAR